MGDLQVGDRIPGYREIAQTWQVGPSTALAALTALRKQGVISADRGQSATVLRLPLIKRLTAGRYRHGDVHGPVSADLSTVNISARPSGRVSTEPASPAIARRLHIAPGDHVSRVDYLWTDDHGPLQRSTQWEPLSLTRNTSAEFPPIDGTPHVIARMADIDMLVTDVSEEYTARMPRRSESVELELSEGVPVFFIERTHYASSIPVETADITVRGDRTIISIKHPVEVFQ